jgi:hypothetical protein
VKRSTEWVGFKVHLTEVCSLGLPHLITNVDTTAAHMADAAHVARGQDELARRELLPRRQLVDGSYIGSQLVLESRDKHDIELVGPAKQNSHHTRVQSGYDLSGFKIDWEERFAICPQGKKSTGWWTDKSPTGRVSIHTKFSRTDCAKCSSARRTAKRTHESWPCFLVRNASCWQPAELSSARRSGSKCTTSVRELRALFRRESDPLVCGGQDTEDYRRHTCRMSPLHAQSICSG